MGQHGTSQHGSSNGRTVQRKVQQPTHKMLWVGWKKKQDAVCIAELAHGQTAPLDMLLWLVLLLR
jgi:hypothetical protein